MITTVFNRKHYRYIVMPVFENACDATHRLHRCRQCACCSNRNASVVLSTDEDTKLHNHLAALAPTSPDNKNYCYDGTWIHDVKKERVRMARFILEQS